MKKIWENIEMVYDLLEDDLSKKIFEKKIECRIMGGEDKTIDFMYETYDTSQIKLLERNFGKDVRCAVAGAGNYGEKTYRALVHAGYEVVCFLDNDVYKQGMFKFGKPVVSFTDFCLQYDDVIVILDNLRLAKGFYHELMNLGYSHQKIFFNTDDIVRTSFGNIYFDLPQLYRDEKEIFIDAGCFDGASLVDFIKWCEGNYQKIYAFEPLEQSFKLAERRLKEYKNIELVKCALADKDGNAEFTYSFDGLMGARLGNKGNRTETVLMRSIDSLLNGDRATFIKMDIEGAELEALKGAKQTIMVYKPKLAISLYHKNEDIIEIPLWIHEIMPEYKFYLRHYSNKQWDFVLYCI